MKIPTQTVLGFALSIATLLPIQKALAVEPPSTTQRLPSKAVSAPGPNASNAAATVDVVKMQLADLKAKIQQQDAKIEELKKEIAASKQETKFTTTVLTTGVNKMGEEMKALTSEFKTHTHSYSVGNGVIAAGVLNSGLKQNPNYDVTLVTSNGKSGGRTGPPEK